METETHLACRRVEGTQVVGQAPLGVGRAEERGSRADMCVPALGPEDAVEDEDGDEGEFGEAGPHDGREREGAMADF